METPPEEDLVCLHLDDVAGDPATDPAPADCTVRAIAEALDVEGRTTAYRVGLLETLDEMETDDLVRSRTAPVEGATGERTVFWLTDRGRERAAGTRAELNEQTVVLADGATDAVTGDDLDQYFDDRPLLRALSNRTPDGRVRVDEAGRGEFVGRGAELERLVSLLEDVRNRGSHRVLVSGEAGIGKTTLVERALANARDEGFAVGSTTCQRVATEPFRPLATALEELPGGDAIAARFDEVPAGSFTDPDVRETRRAQLFDDVADGLRDLSTDRPVVLFLDDLQWADSATLDLFVHLAERVDEWIYPVLFAASYRVEAVTADERLAEAVDAVLDCDRSELIELGPLPEPESRRLVAWLTDEAGVPDEFLALLREQTGGNPLLLRETVECLRETGELDPAADRYPTDPDDVAVPTDVETVVRSRLEPFSGPVRRVLEVTSVVGDVVDPGVLAAVLDEAPAAVNDRLDLLSASRLLAWRGDRVEFVGSVVREAIYEGLDVDRRRDVHDRTAGAILEVAEASGEERYGRVAHHYERAGDLECALEFYRKAARRASDAYAHDVAIEHYEAAIDLARDLNRDESVAELRLGLGRASYHRGDLERASRHFDAVCEQADDDEVFMAAAHHEAEIQVDRGEFEAAVETAQEGIDRWNGVALSPTICRLLMRKGWALLQNGRPETADEVLGRALSLARELGDDEVLGRALHVAGTLELFEGNVDAVIETYETAIEVTERSGDRRGRGRALHNLALGYRWQGDYERARGLFEEALAIQDDIGDAQGATSSRVNLGQVAMARGEWDRALEHLESARSAARERDLPRMEAIATGDIGNLGHKQGELRAAGEALADSVELCDRLGQQRQRATYHALYAEWRCLTGDLAAAWSHAKTGLDAASSSNAEAEIAMARNVLARVCRERGQTERAIEHHETAVDITEDVTGERADADARRNVHEPFARTLLAVGRVTEATEYAERALETVEAIGDPFEEVVTRITLGACRREAGDHAAAADHLETALDGARDLGARVQECRARYELGLLERARGDVDGARTAIEAAREMAGEMGATLLERRCDAALSSLEGRD